MNTVSETWFSPHRQTLSSFAHKIEQCIGHADWETLEQVLQERQTFLEALAIQSIPDAYKGVLKQCLQEVLQQDAQYIALIQAQKQAIAQQQASLETGRRAIQAYKSF